MRKDNFGITPILLYFNDTLMPDFQKSLCIKIDIEIHNKKWGFQFGGTYFTYHNC